MLQLLHQRSISTVGRLLRPRNFTFRPSSSTRDLWTSKTGIPSIRLPPFQIRSFSSSPSCRAKYARFSPDPERPWDVSKWDTGTKLVAAAVVGGGVYYVTHLEQVPETGRWRFMDMSAKYETTLAEQARAELLAEYRDKILPPNHPLTRHVRRVVRRILESSDLGSLKGGEPDPGLSRIGLGGAVEDGIWDPDGAASSGVDSIAQVESGKTREWTLLVVNDEKIANAMASFGNVVVFTGILPVCKDEQGLAAVLGHEIGHVVARHNSERYSSMKVLLFVAYLLDALGLDFGLARILTSLLLELPNSRTQELEADKIGLRLTARACFDPRAAAEMHTRLAEVEKAQGRLNINFLYTHPTSEKRIKLLEDMMPEAYSIQAASPDCSGVLDNMNAFRDFSGNL